MVRKGAGGASGRISTMSLRTEPAPGIAASGKQGAADACGDHLAQRLQARRFQFLALVRRRHAADRERLVAQAMPFLQQEHLLIGELLLADRALGREVVTCGQRDDERFAEQLHLFKVPAAHQQREQQRVQPASAQPLEQVRGQVLAQKEM